MKYQLRLKDLRSIASNEIDISIIMKEIFHFSSSRLFKEILFKKKSKKALQLVREARQIKIQEVKENPQCEIKRPQNIDSISFRAMMELRATMSNTEDVVDMIIKSIGIVCYQKFCDADYDSSTQQYKQFIKRVENSPMYDMLGLYNWIDRALIESDRLWSERFLSVEIIDKDYEQAGGDRMSQFNINTSIKTICRDYNVGYKEAWQVSFAMVQTNSYALATQNHIQDNMTTLKEARMKAERSVKQ